MLGLDLGRLIRVLILVYLMEQYGLRTMLNNVDSIPHELKGDPSSEGFTSGHSFCYAYTRSTVRLKLSHKSIQIQAFSFSNSGLKAQLQVEAETILREESGSSTHNLLNVHALLCNPIYLS